ncbi:MAG: rhamnogalacturonan acetylesterase [Lentisphaerae bacterium]|nr:rhamnogalacturonan acetylesterase [Lentisphaerota bacterium]
MKKFLSLLASAVLLPLMAVDIYLAGDSTMADYPAEHAPQTGWGQALKRYTKDGVKVHNFARGGRSSKSFRAEGRWTMLLNQVSPGDYVFIQFGHNDAHQGAKNAYRHSDPETEYPENLRQYIRDVRAKKATPIICTPIVFMSYRNGEITQSEYFAKYSAAARKVAAEEKADLIDLNQWSQEELTRLGGEKAKTYYMWLKPGQYKNFPKGREDSCHLQEAGAHFYVQGMLKLAKAQNLAVAKCFNDTPAAKPAAQKVNGTGHMVNMNETFYKLGVGTASVAIEEESETPWDLMCFNGSKYPVCDNNMLHIDHTAGEMRLMSKAKIVTGTFKARIRINEAVGPFNAFIGQISVNPWMKHGASFHFNNPNLRANMTIDGKRKSTPPLKKGKWHDLEIRYTDDTITYVLDGNEIFSAGSPAEKGAKSALFVINCRKGGKLNMDIDSVQFEGLRASANNTAAEKKYSVPVPTALAPRKTPAAAPLQITVGKKSATVSNRYFSMKFDGSKDLMLTSLVNKFSGKELLAKPTPFYSVFLNQSRIKTADYQVAGISRKGDSLIFKLNSAASKTALTIKLDFAADSPEYSAEMVLKNLSGKTLEAAGQWVMQGLQFNKDIAKDGIFFPFESGMAGILDIELNHDYGITATIQLMSGFDTAAGGSFYGYTTDTTGYTKRFTLIKTSNGRRPAVGYSPIPNDSRQWPKNIFDYRKGTSFGWRNFELNALPGKSTTLITGKFGVGASDWRDGIASYRKFSKTFLKKRHTPPRWYQDCFIHLSSHPNSNHHQMTPRTHQGGHFDVVNRRYAYAKAMGKAEKRGLQEIAFWWDYGKENAFLTTFELGRKNITTGCNYEYNIARGGLPALRQEIKDIHAKGGRLVFYTFPEMALEGTDHHRLFGKKCAQMWAPGEYKTSYCRPGRDFVLCPFEHEWVDYLSKKFARIIKETGADGLRLDVMARNYHCFNTGHKHYDGSLFSSMPVDKLAGALDLFQNRIAEVNPEASVTTEHAGTDYIMQYTDGWFSQNINGFSDTGRWGPYRLLNSYQLVFSRFTFPESKVWMHTVGFPREGAMMSLFNAVGFCVTRGEGEFAARTLEENADLIAACVDPVPYIPTLHKDVAANYFPAPGNDKVLYGVYNRSKNPVRAEILEVENLPGFHYMELWADKEVTTREVNGKLRLTAEIAGDTAGNIVRLPQLLKAELQADGMLRITVGNKDAQYDELELKIAYDEDKFDENIIVCQPYNGEVLLPLRNNYKKLIIKLVDGIYLRDQVVIEK